MQLIFSSKCWGFIPGFDVRAFIPQRLSRSPEYFEFVNNVLNLIICESLKETGGMTSYMACTICIQWSRPTAQAGRSWDYLLIMFQDEYPGGFANLINLIPERKPRIAEDQKKKHVLSWDLFLTLTKMQPWDTFSVWVSHHELIEYESSLSQKEEKKSSLYIRSKTEYYFLFIILIACDEISLLAWSLAGLN